MARDLDAILAVQLMVAWAGESVEAESSLGWWRTEPCEPEPEPDLAPVDFMITRAGVL